MTLTATAVPYGFDTWAAVVMDEEGRIVRTSAPYSDEEYALDVAYRGRDRQEKRKKEKR